MYNSQDWYWNATNVAGKFFSSAQSAWVDDTNSGYQAFIAIPENWVTNILTDGELADVLAKAGLPAATIGMCGWTDWGNVSLSDQAVVLLTAGLAVTSTATSALNATYPCNQITQQHVSAEITSILLNETFTDGTTSIEWMDVSGEQHDFTIVQFKTLASALASFVTGCVKCINGQSTVLPATTATIP